MIIIQVLTRTAFSKFIKSLAHKWSNTVCVMKLVSLANLSSTRWKILLNMKGFRLQFTFSVRKSYTTTFEVCVFHLNILSRTAEFKVIVFYSLVLLHYSKLIVSSHISDLCCGKVWVIFNEWLRRFRDNSLIKYRESSINL